MYRLKSDAHRVSISSIVLFLRREFCGGIGPVVDVPRFGPEPFVVGPCPPEWGPEPPEFEPESPVFGPEPAVKAGVDAAVDFGPKERLPAKGAAVEVPA